jgi:exodeoxyribonuclease V gamma subunit
LLSRLQRDLRQGCAPAGDFELDPQDSSIQVHSCHGQARQVQVLRDAILHLLDDDPTLREEDIVVLSPAIDQFAPLVEVGFGISSDEAAATAADTTPRLFYRVTDRSLRESHPVLAAFDSLLALISGRFGASAMLEFVSLPVVQRRFGFDDDSLAKITEWVTSTKVRWGLDGGQRAAFGLPPDFTANSWRAALDRLLMGVALSDDDLDLGPGGIAPYGVASSDIGALGRFADLVARLAKFSGDTRGSRCVLDWCEVISEAIDLRSGRESAMAGRPTKENPGRDRGQSARGRQAGERRAFPIRDAPASRRPAARCARALRLFPRRHHDQLLDTSSMAAVPGCLPARAR